MDLILTKLLIIVIIGLFATPNLISPHPTSTYDDFQISIEQFQTHEESGEYLEGRLRMCNENAECQQTHMCRRNSIGVRICQHACEIAKNLKCDRNSECSGKNHHAVCDCNRGYERVEGRGCVRSQYIIRNDDDDDIDEYPAPPLPTNNEKCFADTDCKITQKCKKRNRSTANNKGGICADACEDFVCPNDNVCISINRTSRCIGKDVSEETIISMDQSIADICLNHVCGRNSFCKTEFSYNSKTKPKCVCAMGFFMNNNQTCIATNEVCVENDDCDYNEQCNLINGYRTCVNVCDGIACGMNKYCSTSEPHNYDCVCNVGYVPTQNDESCVKPGCGWAHKLCKSDEYCDYTNFQYACTKRCPPRRYDITDFGHRPLFHGWADVQGIGCANDWCRIVNNYVHQLSCALAGHRGDHNMVSKLDFDKGAPQSAFMRDMNNDGRDDYCRCVELPYGNITIHRIRCMFATPNGFTGNPNMMGDNRTEFEIPIEPWDKYNCHNHHVFGEFGPKEILHVLRLKV